MQLWEKSISSSRAYLDPLHNNASLEVLVFYCYKRTLGPKSNHVQSNKHAAVTNGLFCTHSVFQDVEYLTRNRMVPYHKKFLF